MGKQVKALETLIRKVVREEIKKGVLVLSLAK